MIRTYCGLSLESARGIDDENQESVRSLETSVRSCAHCMEGEKMDSIIHAVSLKGLSGRLRVRSHSMGGLGMPTERHTGG